MSGASWTLSVENFGPIQSAEVTLAPLTIFTGRNNTGKSYVASLIWAVLNADDVLIRRLPAHGDMFEACRDMARSILDGEKTTAGAGDWAKLCAWIDSMMNDPAYDLVSRVFARADFRGSASRFSLAASGPALDVDVTTDALSNTVDGSRQSSVVRTRYSSGRQLFIVPEDPAPDGLYFESWILRTLIRRLYGHYNEAEYIPAARTGLMLAMKALVSGLFDAVGEDEGRERLPTLPLPVMRFLSAVNAAADRPDHEHFAIARFLEAEILNGRVVRGVNADFRFVADGSTEEIPLHATSSLVTELAPIVVLLKRGIRGSLILEEPEAHLHLTAQRALARALVWLVNTGTPVLITTHGDTLMQQINTLMHLHGHPARAELLAEFGYGPNELLDPAHAIAYGFSKDDGTTTVRALEKTPLGFVEPDMNQTLADITHEIFEMERRERND